MLIRFTQPYPPFELREDADLPDSTAMYLIAAGYADEIDEVETAETEIEAEPVKRRSKPRKSR